MVDREKVIKGLECCAVGAECDHCPYASMNNGGFQGCYQMHQDALALLKAQEPIEARLHLCESCTKKYPECDAAIDGIEFGSGIGNDNIIGCTVYVNRWKAQEPRVMNVGDVRNWVNSDRVTREPVVIEIRGGVCAWIIDDEVRELPGNENLSSDLYGKTWRCWTFRPDDATREATPWK